MEDKIRDKRFIMGIIFLIVGGFILAGNFNIIPDDIRKDFKKYFWHWPMILVALGLMQLTIKEYKFPGLILLLIGGIFMMPHLFDLSFTVMEIFWPAIFIIVGISILVRSRSGDHKDFCKMCSSDDQNVIDDMAFFGGGDKIITSQNFKGGRITCVFGGINYNFLRCKLSPEKNIADVFCIFGGMKMIVPEDWDIKIQVTSIFGGFADKRNIAPTAMENKQGELVIRGMAIFGGGEIKNF